jgi:hypothetical protein
MWQARRQPYPLHEPADKHLFGSWCAAFPARLLLKQEVEDDEHLKYIYWQIDRCNRETWGWFMRLGYGNRGKDYEECRNACREKNRELKRMCHRRHMRKSARG